MKIDFYRERWNRIGGIVCITLLALQLAVFLLSWIISAISPDLPVRSLLGGEGIRWFFGNYLKIIGSNGAASLILLLIAGGAVAQSRILHTIGKWVHREPLTYRQKYALRASAFALLFFVAILIALTCSKEAVLLSASGNLFPSSFSKALVPIVSFILTFIAILFGMLSAQFQNIGDLFHALYVGLQYGASLLLLYVFVCQFVASAYYAFLP